MSRDGAATNDVAKAKIEALEQLLSENDLSGNDQQSEPRQVVNLRESEPGQVVNQ